MAHCALRVSAALMNRSRVVLARLGTAAGDVDGVAGAGGPRSCSKVTQGPLDTGGDVGSLTTGGLTSGSIVGVLVLESQSVHWHG